MAIHSAMATDGIAPSLHPAGGSKRSTTVGFQHSSGPGMFRARLSAIHAPKRKAAFAFVQSALRSTSSGRSKNSRILRRNVGDAPWSARRVARSRCEHSTRASTNCGSAHMWPTPSSMTTSARTAARADGRPRLRASLSAAA